MFNSVWIPLWNDYKDITGSEVIYGGEREWEETGMRRLNAEMNETNIWHRKTAFLWWIIGTKKIRYNLICEIQQILTRKIKRNKPQNSVSHSTQTLAQSIWRKPLASPLLPLPFLMPFPHLAVSELHLP